MVDSPGDKLLAGAAFPRKQNRCSRLGHLFHHRKNALHGLAVADNIFETVTLLQVLFQSAVFGQEVAQLQSFTDGKKEFLILKGLENIIKSPFFHGFHRLFHRAVGGHHNDRQVRIYLFELLHKFNAAHSGHLHISNNYIQIIAPYLFQGLFTTINGENLISGPGQ